MKTFHYFLCFDKESKQPFQNFQPINFFGLTNLFTLAHLKLVKHNHLRIYDEIDTHSKDTQTISTQENQVSSFQRCKYSELEMQEQNETFFVHMEKKLNPNPKEIFWTLTYNQHYSFMTYARIY
jgi:hypothetical protein